MYIWRRNVCQTCAKCVPNVCQMCAKCAKRCARACITSCAKSVPNLCQTCATLAPKLRQNVANWLPNHRKTVADLVAHVDAARWRQRQRQRQRQRRRQPWRQRTALAAGAARQRPGRLTLPSESGVAESIFDVKAGPTRHRRGHFKKNVFYLFPPPSLYAYVDIVCNIYIYIYMYYVM